MKIDIKISNTMTKECDWNRGFENRIIRLPLHCRQEFNLSNHDFVNLNTKDGIPLNLQIAPAFKEDVAEDPTSAYVTAEVFEVLEGNSLRAKDVETVKNITLGCDPELFIIDCRNGGLVSARSYFGKSGDVGNDGMLLEFRPLPSTDETIVTDNIMNLISKARMMLNLKPQVSPHLMLYGASNYQGATAGFHLHYGVPYQMLGFQRTVKTVIRQVVKAMDYYVGVPAIIPEGNTDTRRRTSTYIKYGKPGEFRIDNRTLEYRVPGGSLLRHPILTNGILALGAVVIEDIVSRINACTDNFANMQEMQCTEHIHELYPNMPSNQKVFSMICVPEVTYAFSKLNDIYTDIQKMVGYKARKPSVDAFFNCLFNGVQFGNNIEENWGRFYNEKHARQMDVHSK